MENTQSVSRGALSALMLALFLAALDSTIVTTALPVIATHFHARDNLPWIVSVFLLTSTLVLPLYGKLGDVWGRRNALLVSQGLFTLGTILCAFSPTFWALVAFRGLQGLGAGGLLVLAFAGVGDIVPLRERGKYQGLFAGTFGLASIAGPLLGGSIVSFLGWRYVFFVTVPVSAIAGYQALRYLPAPKERLSAAHLDILGSLYLVLALLALFVAPQVTGMPSLLVWGAAALLFYLLARHEHPHKVLPGALFRSRTFTVSALASVVVGFVFLGTLSYIPTWLQLVQGYSPVVSGILLLPMLVALGGASVLGGRWTSKHQRYKALPFTGIPLASLGLLLLAQVTTPQAMDYFWAGTVCLGAGLGLTLQVLVLSAQIASPREHLGVATSTIALFRTYGGTLGTLILGFFYSAEVQVHGVLRGIPLFFHGTMFLAGILLLVLVYPLILWMEEMPKASETNS